MAKGNKTAQSEELKQLGEAVAAASINRNEPRPFVKRQVEIQAIQSTGTLENNSSIIDWTNGSETPASMGDHPERGKCLTIVTLEGAHWVDAGDYVIRGIAGEFYPCKPDIFEKSYDPVEGDDDIDLDGDPLSDDLPVWAGFRAQRSAARALAGDQDTEHLGLAQCEAISYLVRKSPKSPSLAMLKHLELCRIPADMPRGRALFLANSFRCTMLNAEAFLSAVAATSALMPEPRRISIPRDESTLELADEPFALTETARSLQGLGR